VAIRLQERLLMHVLGVLLVAQHVQRKSQDGLVVAPHQRVEGACGRRFVLPESDRRLQHAAGRALPAAPVSACRRSCRSWFRIAPRAWPSLGTILSLQGDFAPTRAAASISTERRSAGANAFAPRARPPPTIAESTGEIPPPPSSPIASAFIVSDSGARKWITSIDRRAAKR